MTSGSTLLRRLLPLEVQESQVAPSSQRGFYRVQGLGLWKRNGKYLFRVGFLEIGLYRHYMNYIQNPPRQGYTTDYVGEHFRGYVHFLTPTAPTGSPGHNYRKTERHKSQQEPLQHVAMSSVSRTSYKALNPKPVKQQTHGLEWALMLQAVLLRLKTIRPLAA